MRKLTKLFLVMKVHDGKLPTLTSCERTKEVTSLTKKTFGVVVKPDGATYLDRPYLRIEVKTLPIKLGKMFIGLNLDVEDFITKWKRSNEFFLGAQRHMYVEVCGGGHEIRPGIFEVLSLIHRGWVPIRYEMGDIYPWRPCPNLTGKMHTIPFHLEDLYFVSGGLSEFMVTTPTHKTSV